ncbi:MAG: carbon monoxide dehydrogenase subunit G [Sneathiella sp.]
MLLEDQQKIKASPQTVFAALNDPSILKECIPGCDTLEKTSETEMTATITLKIGPVKAKFAGQVTLSNINPPKGYTISGQGKAGPAGHAKGGADVTLIEEADGSTLLKYDVKADVGGKIAQLGGRLIDSTAKKLSAQFFEKFAAIVAEKEIPEPVALHESEVPSVDKETTEQATSTSKGNSVLWLIIAAAIGVIAWYFLT